VTYSCAYDAAFSINWIATKCVLTTNKEDFMNEISLTEVKPPSYGGRHPTFLNFCEEVTA